MKKEQDLSNEEIIAKLYVNIFLQLRDNTLAIIESYDKQKTFLLNELYELRDNEPWKIFRKAHREWEKTVKKIQTDYESTFNKYIKECHELEEIMKLAKIDN